MATNQATPVEAPAAASWRLTRGWIFLVAKRMHQHTDKVLAPYGLSEAALRLLYLLYDRGPLALGEISRLLYLSKSYVTSVVDALEKNRFVQRVRDEVDRRSVRATMTEQGRRQYEVALEAMEQANWTLGGLSEAERRRLTELLEFIFRHYEADPPD